MEKDEMQKLINRSLQGDMQAMETILMDVKDLVFNLSLRMLGLPMDAQDASQDIMIKIMTNLSGFRKEADFKTWVYRIAVNYLMDYRKSMFSQHPLDFAYYANDTAYGVTKEPQSVMDEKVREKLAEELKLSCTNVMLQCFDARTRCVYILGTMFHVNSNVAADILDMTPANYRQILSRAKKKMSGFLEKYCGLCDGMCSCEKRVPYAIEQHRLQPDHLEFSALHVLDKEILEEYCETMEIIDEAADIFETMPHYYATIDTREFIRNLIHSDEMKKMKGYIPS